MALNAEDRKYVHAVWTHAEAHAELYGGDVLYRLFLSNPPSKTRFPACNRDSPQIRAQSKKVVDARTEAVKHMDNNDGSQCELTDYGKKIIDALTEVVNHLDNIDRALCNLNVDDLRVGPKYFPFLAHNIMVTFAVRLPSHFDCPTQQSLGKFLDVVGGALKFKLCSTCQE